MALDKLVDSAQLDSDLASVADAIRTKGGTSAQLAFPQGFVDAIAAIEAGGGEAVGGVTWSEFTATATATNMEACSMLLFGTRLANHLYIALLVNKKISDFVTDQLICYDGGGERHAMGTGARYHSDTINTIVGGTHSYDAKIEVGDKYIIADIDYS